MRVTNPYFRFRNHVYCDGEQGGQSGESGGESGGQNQSGQNQGGKTFTEDQVNKIVQQRLARQSEANAKTLEQLEQLKKIKTLSDEDRTNLQNQIDELNSALLTKEELAAKEKKKLEESLNSQVKIKEQEAQTWQNRFTDSTIVRSITDSAVSAEAYRPNQIVALLRPQTRLVEEMDGEGKPTGNFTPRVKFLGRDKDGKPVTLDLTIDETLKQMKEMTDEYGNLFKSGATSGLGGSNNSDGIGGGLGDLKDTSRYIKLRQSGKLPLEKVKA